MLKLKPDEFWKLTWAEYDVMCEGHAKDVERRYQEQWEVVRWEVYHLLQPHIKKGSIKRLTDLIRFPWDVRGDFEPSTRDRFEELCEKWGKTLA